MKIFSPADKASNDSIEYKFLNLNWCAFHEVDDTFLITYKRQDDLVDDEFSFEELADIHPYFIETAAYLCKAYQRKSAELVDAMIATSALLFDSYIDLEAAEIPSAGYQFLTQIKSVRSRPAAGLFDVECIYFKKDTSLRNGMDAAVVDAFDTKFFHSYQIDKIWPGSSKQIPLMESLGYSDSEVLDSLYKGIIEPQEPQHIHIPSF